MNIFIVTKWDDYARRISSVDSVYALENSAIERSKEIDRNFNEIECHEVKDIDL